MLSRASETEWVCFSDPPEVTAVREWVHTGHGAKSELTCFVEAEPNAKVHNRKCIFFSIYDNFVSFCYLNKKLFQVIWQRPDGTTYPPYSSTRVAVSVLENQHSLIIRSVRDTDLGLYSCIAQNSLGETKAEIELSGMIKVK
jgi:Immunoglobulin I-set domain